MLILKQCLKGFYPACGWAAAMVFMTLTLSLLLPLAALAANTWTATGSLAVGRYNHTATLLPNGKVLVVGGNGNNIRLGSAQLYDPATGTWTPTGSLTTAREQHTAILLANGKVLVAGGYNPSSPYYLASAELYDPATGNWTATGSLATGRGNHTATLLPSGQILVVGGWDNSGPLASAELYDPAANGGVGAWTPMSSLHTGRYGHTATLLPGGQVLVVGGWGNSGIMASAEIYDPATGNWIPAGSLATARYAHTATLLPNGQVLFAGGGGLNGSLSIYLSSAELYNPATEIWTTTGSLATGRVLHTATLLSNGQVLVAGGNSPSATEASTELYDPAANNGIGAWTATGSLATGRNQHTATLLPNGQVLVAGGVNNNNYLYSAELFDPAAGGWSATGSLTTGRFSHTATLLPNSQVLVAGGNDRSGYAASAELYDPAANGGAGAWTPTGSLLTARQYHTATLLPCGQVLVAGGDVLSGNTTELYDPATGRWSRTGSLGTARQSHTATLLPNGKVLVAGGGQWNGAIYTSQASAELYDPATGRWTPTSSLATARYAHTATLLPNGKVLVAGGYGNGGYLPLNELYDPATGNWAATGSLTYGRYYHTATLLPNGHVLVAGGSGSIAFLSSAELYDPAAAGGVGAWTPTTNGFIHARYSHTATLLPNGKVLVAGGIVVRGGKPYPTNYAELYDPATGLWTGTGVLANPHAWHTATLLPNGQVLVAGSGYDYFDSAALYDPGLGFQPAWRPQINSLAQPYLLPGAYLSINGSRFRGISEASGGATNDSATDYPLVQFRRLDNEQMSWLLPDPAHPFSASFFESKALGGLPSGHYLVTVFANAIPSASGIIRFGAAPNPPKRGMAGMMMLLLD